MSGGVLSEGSVFADRYEVVRCIATGGMGAVYEAIHTETRRRSALKVMLPHCIQSDEMRKRFRLEARVAADVQSEHIVDVIDAGIDAPSGMPFLVMELLHGEDLGKRLHGRGALAPADVIEYLRQAALALDKTHRASIVHRDLKPDNLFLCERDEGPPRVKILDFGIAKLLADSSTQANATRSMGTPVYMAPEQFDPDSSISPATDIFALGMIAYTLLCGVPYWYEESKLGLNVFAFAARVCSGPDEPATERSARMGTTLPPAFDAWFAKATAFAPQDRFPSALEAVRTLAEALGQTERVSLVVPAFMPSDRPIPSRGFGEASTVEVPAMRTPLNTLGTGPSPDKPRRRPLVVTATLLVLALLGAGSLILRAVLAPPQVTATSASLETTTQEETATLPIVLPIPIAAPTPSAIAPVAAEPPPSTSAAPSTSTPAPASTLRAPAKTRPTAASTATAPPRSTSIYSRD